MFQRKQCEVCISTVGCIKSNRWVASRVPESTGASVCSSLQTANLYAAVKLPWWLERKERHVSLHRVINVVKRGMILFWPCPKYSPTSKYVQPRLMTDRFSSNISVLSRSAERVLIAHAAGGTHVGMFCRAASTSEVVALPSIACSYDCDTGVQESNGISVDDAFDNRAITIVEGGMFTSRESVVVRQGTVQYKGVCLRSQSVSICSSALMPASH